MISGCLLFIRPDVHKPCSSAGTREPSRDGMGIRSERELFFMWQRQGHNNYIQMNSIQMSSNIPRVVTKVSEIAMLKKMCCRRFKDDAYTSAGRKFHILIRPLCQRNHKGKTHIDYSPDDPAHILNLYDLSGK